VPAALGVVVEPRDLVWDAPGVIDFVRAHRLCVVNEPHPFTVPEPVPAEVLAALLPPSDTAAALVAAAAGRDGLTLGLHVRQTDYRRWQGGRLYRDDAFYNALARGALERLPAGSKLVIAHDGEFAAAPDVAGDARVEVSRGTEAEATRDFVRFATCDLLVGPWSTFTIQAARLGQVWAPRRRDLIHLRPESTLEDLLAALGQRLNARRSAGATARVPAP
jgi:hypothetical protein